jgi:hypothetical protein
MLLDKVEDRVWRYRREKDDEKRSAMLAKLGRPQDARVVVVLGETLEQYLALRDKGEITESGQMAGFLLSDCPIRGVFRKPLG